jgi:hypothetical protein
MRTTALPAFIDVMRTCAGDRPDVFDAGRSREEIARPG